MPQRQYRSTPFSDAARSLGQGAEIDWPKIAFLSLLGGVLVTLLAGL